MAQFRRWHEESRGELMRLAFLFFRATIRRIINEDLSLTMEQDVRSFVEKCVPELIVALISAAKLDKSFLRIQPLSGAANVGSMQFGDENHGNADLSTALNKLLFDSRKRCICNTTERLKFLLESVPIE
jgi:hypothetical protein